MKSSIFFILIFVHFFNGFSKSWAATSLPAGAPTLDEMAGDWIPDSIASNLPDVHNFNQMLIVNRDLTSFFCSPGGLFERQDGKTTQWRAGYPLIKLTLDNVEYKATDFRWFPYCVLRRNLDCNGLKVQTDIRMINEQRGVLCLITITNPNKTLRTDNISLQVPGTLDGSGPGVIYQNSRTTSAIQPSFPPDSTKDEANVVEWNWKLNLVPDAQIKIGFVVGDDSKDHVTATKRKVADWAAHFDDEMSAFQEIWQKRWADAFTPHNDHFSGNLPILKTDSDALRRNYYMGALTMLILERTQFPIPRSFITSGERSDGIQYYWDASMQATAWALLEPEGMKAVLRRWLTQNPRGGPHISLSETHGFDSKHYDLINGYATNACTIFRTTDAYLRITRDQAFLDDKLENGQTVLQALDALATDFETLPKTPLGLANYGGNGKLLETASSYIEGVASVNAQNIYMMRRAAEWQSLKGNESRAEELRAKAKAFLPTVLGLFNSETGAWNASRMNGNVIPVQHCVDFIYAGDALVNDLNAQQKKSMIDFVKRELLTKDWMRAMSWKDPCAPRAFRPDHSPTGSYDGWIPLTIGTMWRLGSIQEAYDFYCRTAVVTKEGAFAQAHEFYGPTPASNDAPVRIALHGSNMKECISGVAFTDVVINTFFGFDPSVDGKKLLVDEETARPFSGTLDNVHHGKFLYTLWADKNGLRFQKSNGK